MAHPVAAPAAAADEGGASSHLLPESSSRIHPARLKAAVRLTGRSAASRRRLACRSRG